MLNFTIGPVIIGDAVRCIVSGQIPYFRTTEFSEVMFENERLMKKLAKSGEHSRVVFVTGSGTASMEASVMNLFTKEDRLLIINGGSFGERFCKICEIHEIPYTEINPALGRNVTEEMLLPYEGQGFSGFLVNLNETSTGVLYDIELISDFCRRNNIFLVVDSISSFLCDPFDMERLDVQVMITGSQKALACPPGISVIVLSEKAVMRVNAHHVRSMYLDLKDALKDGERGQTPFTPAVGTILQINARLKEIDAVGGVATEIQRVGMLAEDFRTKIKGLPFEIISESLSNAVTPLHPLTTSAYDIYTILKNDYGIWVCPNGGVLREKVFRVGHLGDLTIDDNSKLIEAFEDLRNRHII